MTLGSIARKSLLMVGVWDSAVVSLSGFLTNVLAGRYLTTNDYGLFITAFIVSNIGILVQSSFVSSPYAIFAPRLKTVERRDYLACSTWIGAGVSIGIALLLSTVIGFYFRKTMQGSDLIKPVALFGFYSATSTLQDFTRRACFVHRREGSALVLDVTSAGGQIILLVGLRSWMTLNLALLLVSITTAMGLLAVYLLCLRCKPLPLRMVNMRKTIRENISFGKWLFFTAGVSWIANQIYILAVAAFQAPLVVAQLSAARTIAAISNPAVMTVDNMGTPRASQIVHERGTRALRAFILKIATLGSLPFVVVGGFSFFYPDIMIRLLFHRSFGDIHTLVRIFSLMPFLWFASRSIVIGINALKKPKSLLPVYLAIAFVTLTLGIYLARNYGARGAAIGLLFNSILMVIGFTYQFMALTKVDSVETARE